MDTVRFGRVLGQGARHAAKTLVSAVDAATAPNPHPPAARPSAPSSIPPAPPSPSPVQPSTTPPSASPRAGSTPRPGPSVVTVLPPAPPRTQPVSATTSRGFAEGSRRFGRAVWAPAVRLSGVLWLELTGVFFGLFALIAAIASWHLRFALHAVPAPNLASGSAINAVSDDRTHLFFAVGMVLVFGYFSLSSFLKANRRSRKP